MEIVETVDVVSFRFHPQSEAQKAQPAGLSIQNLGGVLYQVDDLGNLTALIGGGGGGITALTGDVAASGAGSVNSTIQPNVVTYAKFQRVAGNNALLGNVAGVNSNVQELSPGTVRGMLGLASIATSGSASDLTGGTLPAGTFPAFTGDVTTVAGATATTIAANAVTTAKINANAVTLAKLATQANNTILGNNSGGAAVPSALTVAQTLTLLGFTGVSAGTYTNATVTVSAAGIVTAIANGGGGGSYTFTSGLTNTGGTVTNDVVLGKASGDATWIGSLAASATLQIQANGPGPQANIVLGTSTATGFVTNENGTTAQFGIATAAAGSVMHLKKAQNAQTIFYVENNSAGGAAITTMALGSADTVGGAAHAVMNLYGTGYTTAGLETANAFQIALNGAGAANLLYTIGGTGTHIWTLGGDAAANEVMSLAPNGVLTLFGASGVSGGTIQGNSGGGNVLTIQDVAAGTTIIALSSGVATVKGTIVPSADFTYSLGSSGAHWQNLYVSSANITQVNTPTIVAASNGSFTSTAGTTTIGAATDLALTAGSGHFVKVTTGGLALNDATASWAANGSAVLTLGAVGPTGTSSGGPRQFLIVYESGVAYYIPAY